MPVRKALGFPTIFNLLGPLTNPAGAGRQVMGVWDAERAPIAAETLHRLGTVRSVVLHAEDGLDEASIAAATRLWIATIRSPVGIAPSCRTTHRFVCMCFAVFYNCSAGW